MNRFVIVLPALLLTLLVLASCSKPPANSSAQPTADIAGNWSASIVRVKSTNSDPSGKTTQSAIPMQLTTYKTGNTTSVVGTYGGIQVHGTVNGDVVSLELYLAGGGRNGGTTDQGNMTLHIDSKDKLIGHIVGSDPVTGSDGLHVDEITLSRNSATASLPFTRAAEAAPNMDWSSNLCAVETNLLNYGISYTTFAAAPGAFTACGAVLNGGGYYMFGDIGPNATIKPFNKATLYLPIESAVCTGRNYTFTMRLAGQNESFSKIKSYLTDASGNTKVNPADPDVIALLQGATFWAALDLVNNMEAIYKDLGNFAVVLGTNTNDMQTTVYILSDKLTATTDLTTIASLTPVTAALAKLTDNLNLTPPVKPLTGSQVQDTMNLVRSSLDFPNPCNTPAVFWYLFGTANVTFD